MILESIILENFGTYAGRQEANLEPEPDKPIILFGGMNGGGKTTLLDAVQLAFYGAKAKLSNRGKLRYKDYLRESIHRGSDPKIGAGIVLRFRRNHEGGPRQYELHRHWHETTKGIQETFDIYVNGQIDHSLTGQWDEIIEAYLPSRIAHLFFFDGEQIKELAEGGHAAEILGTAVNSLLGLDLVDRLETDLKVFERRKRAEGLDEQALERYRLAETEYQHIDQEYAKVLAEAGQVRNETERLEKEMRLQEFRFRQQGGDLYQRRKEIEIELESLKAHKATIEARYRELLAGPLPFLWVRDLLAQVEVQARHENEIKRARLLRDSLADRDAQLLTTLEQARIPEAPIKQIQEFLAQDRQSRAGLADEELLFDADEDLAVSVNQMLNVTLPSVEKESQALKATAKQLNEQIARLERERERIPSEDSIAQIQQDLEQASRAYAVQQTQYQAIRWRVELLEKQRNAALAKLDKFGEQELEGRYAEDDRQRMPKHSKKVRETLAEFRARVVRRHTARMEVLMLESFRQLLRKTELVTGLHIDPESFEPTLTGPDGNPLPIERLSAGERQLLATAMLWGLARASGRPIPTIIDTPLGRLDSTHRRHLIERYFPHASHQVLLLSTDEEIVGSYLRVLKLFVSKTYLLAYDEEYRQTRFKLGYFPN